MIPDQERFSYMKWLLLILSTMTLLMFAQGCGTSKQHETTSNDGLASKKITDETGVPWLSEVPVLGWLFKTNITQKVDNASSIQSETTSKTSTPPKVTLKSDDLEGIDVNESKYVSLPVSSTVDFGSYHALVVGINEYQHLPYLKTASNDARTLAKILENDYGFQVTLLLNSTRADILTTLRKYRGVLTAHDNLLIYFAGHGLLDRTADEGYWLPADAMRDNEVNWISNANMTSTIRAMQAKHVMIVADSCYSGKLVRGIHIKPKTPDYLTRISRKKARVVLSSGGLEPVIDSGGEGEHSVFASAFIQALRDNTGIMDGSTLFTKIRRLVMLNSDQTPEYSDIRKAGHDGGDFLFVRSAVRANDGRAADQ